MTSALKCSNACSWHPSFQLARYLSMECRSQLTLPIVSVSSFPLVSLSSLMSLVMTCTMAHCVGHAALRKEDDSGTILLICIAPQYPSGRCFVELSRFNWFTSQSERFQHNCCHYCCVVCTLPFHLHNVYTMNN